MRSHTDQRPFSCNLCGVTFRQNTGLKKHMMAHEAKKRSFSCNFCDKIFVKHTHYAEHKQKDHFIPMIYSCPICKQEFSDKDKLTLHQKIHVQEKEKGDLNAANAKMEVKDDEEMIKVKEEPMDSDNSGMFIYFAQKNIPIKYKQT